jgi:hypothetical protein
MYDTAKNKWHYIAKLPLGHNVSCNVCLNYHDKAIFTFTLDGKFCLKSAVLPL